MPARGGSRRLLATVLFTDIVGSTELASKLGDRRWRELLNRHHAAVRRGLKSFGGREMDTAGDGFFAIFDRPTEAVACAFTLVQSAKRLGIDIRAGLHMGECEVIDGKVGGIAVHIGARVAANAEPGEVLVSGTLKELVSGSDFRFEDKGTKTLKGVPGEWRLFGVEAPPLEEPVQKDAQASKRRWSVPLVAGALSAVALGTALAVVSALMKGTSTRTSGSPSTSPSATRAVDRVVRIDLATKNVTAQIPVGRSPTAIAVGEGSVWVANFDDDTVSRIDPANGKVVATIPVGNGPIGIAIGANGVWVAGRFANAVTRIDPGSNTIVKSIAVGKPYDVTVEEGNVWVASPGETSRTGTVITRIDPESNDVSWSVPLKVNAGFNNLGMYVAASEGSVWVGMRGGHLIRVDSDRAITRVQDFAQGITGIAIDDGAVWVASGVNDQVGAALLAGTVERVNPVNGRIEAVLQIGKSLGGIAVAGGTVWAAGGDGTLSRILTLTNQVQEPINVGRQAIDVAVGYRSVWVTVDAP